LAETEVEDGIEVDLHHVARIVASYLRHHKIDATEIAPLISRVRQSLAGAGREAKLMQAARTLRCRSGARCNRITSFASNAGSAARHCGGT
jgi:predicted transcriptional regulator